MESIVEPRVLILAHGAELSKLTMPNGTEIQFDANGAAIVPKHWVSPWEHYLTDAGMSVTDWPIPGHA